MRRGWWVMLVAVLTLAACGDAAFVAQNALLDPAKQCSADPVDKVATGVLDLADTYPEDPANMASVLYASDRTYVANLIIEKADNDDRKLVIDSVDLTYDFNDSPNQPSADTVNNLPAIVNRAVSASLGPDTRASDGAAAGTALVSIELVSPTVSAILASDTQIFDMLQPPNRYPMTVHIKLNGRFVGGGEFTTSNYYLPIELCRGCLVGVATCRTTCYDPWQDCQ